MSHNDYISKAAPGFDIIAHTADCPVAAVQNVDKKLYATQFHPEVLHTQEGKKMLSNFVYNVCGCSGDWKMDSFVENSIKAIREKVGDGKVLCALCLLYTSRDSADSLYKFSNQSAGKPDTEIAEKRTAGGLRYGTGKDT